MNTDEIRQLLEKYYDGNTSVEEEETLRQFFSRAEIPSDLEPDADLFRFYMSKKEESAPVDDAWQKALDERGTASVLWLHSSVFRGMVRVAAVVIFMLVGFAAGVIYSRVNETAIAGNQTAAASVTRFEKIPSASERIKLISQVSERVGANNSVIEALIQSMNNDDNVNVRLEAAQALFRFSGEPVVRQALVRSLPNQDDPNIQIALIDMFVKLHEKQAVHEMRVMLLQENLNPVVRYKLMAGIGALS